MGRVTVQGLAPLTALACLAGCGGEPIAVRERAGTELADLATGLGGRNREVCLRMPGGDCETVMRVHALRHVGDLSAHWLSDNEIEIFLVGGRVRKCETSAPGGVRVRLHRWSEEPGRAPDVADHGPTSSFRKLPDVCAEFA